MTEVCISRTGVVTYPQTWTELRNDCVGATYNPVIVPYGLLLSRLRFHMKSDRTDGRGLAWVRLCGPGMRNGEYIACVGSYQENEETVFDEAIAVDTVPGNVMSLCVCLDGGDTGAAKAEVSLWWSDNPGHTRQNIGQRSPVVIEKDDGKYEKILGEVRRMLRLMEKQVFKDEERKKEETNS